MARVALAEHSPEIRNLVSLTLKGAGHHVDLFSDGAATLLALGERSYDLLICDVAIPKLDGISLCRAVRKRTASREMPIVLLSPRPLGQLTLDGYEAGADDFIETPCAASLLRSRVDQALRSSRDWELATRLPELGPQIGLPARYDRYELQELLGRGGFSTVYRGVDPNGQEVALKLFKGGMVENRVALGRFFREVATLRDLNSPGIVPVLGSGFAQGRFYIAMKLILGLSAGELLSELGPFEIAEACRLGRDVAQALHDLGQHGLVHRDVKPPNIMIQPAGQCVLVDFGLAKGSGDISITSSGELIGTGPYLAPEVIHGPGAESMASDLYSLGASVYELLSGQLPFAGEGHILFHRIASGSRPPSLASLRPELPPELVTLVEELMEPDPNLRLKDPLEVARRFGALAS